MRLPFPLARDGQEIGHIERVNDGLPHVLPRVPRERANERFETVIGFDMRDVPGCLDGALDECGPRFDLFGALAADEQHRRVVSVEHGSCVEVTERGIELVGAFKRMLIEAARGPKHLRGEGAGALLPATLLLFEKGFALLIVLHDEALAPPDLEGERPEGTQDPRERIRGIAAERDGTHQALSEGQRVALEPVLGEQDIEADGSLGESRPLPAPREAMIERLKELIVSGFAPKTGNLKVRA